MVNKLIDNISSLKKFLEQSLDNLSLTEQLKDFKQINIAVKSIDIKKICLNLESSLHIYFRDSHDTKEYLALGDIIGSKQKNFKNLNEVINNYPKLNIYFTSPFDEQDGNLQTEWEEFGKLFYILPELEISKEKNDTTTIFNIKFRFSNKITKDKILIRLNSLLQTRSNGTDKLSFTSGRF